MQWLCEQIIDGRSMTEIAAELGMHKATLSRWAAKTENRDQVYAARVASAETFDELALAAIRKAKNKLQLGKAKEEAHHLRWRASKINPAQYGEKLQTELSGPGGGPVQVTDPARPKLTREEWLAAHGVKVPTA